MRDVVITGIGLVSSLGEGGETHFERLSTGATPVHDLTATAPYPIHPLAPLDLDTLIPKKSDQRQMEPWQRLGVYAAGLALRDGGVLGNAELLPKIHMIVAAGSGERDIATDEAIMTGIRAANDRDAYLNEQLSNNLRPTLFLAQLPNLLAGNISIIFGVTGSSRTFMGEEAAGLDALASVAARIRSGDVEMGLVGGAYSAPRPDMALVFALGGALLSGDPAPVWSRQGRGGGMVLGSVGAFLLLESRAHAEARGARIAATLGPVLSDRSRRTGDSTLAMARSLWSRMEPALAPGPLGVLSGATGVEPVTGVERTMLEEAAARREIVVRASGTLLGHGIEAAVPANVGLAALALSHGAFYPPFETDTIERPATKAPEQIAVTSFGHWRGEGLVLLRRATSGGSA